MSISPAAASTLATTDTFRATELDEQLPDGDTRMTAVAGDCPRNVTSPLLSMPIALPVHDQAEHSPKNTANETTPLTGTPNDSVALLKSYSVPSLNVITGRSRYLSVGQLTAGGRVEALIASVDLS